MAERFYEKKLSLDSLQRGLLLPLLTVGGGFGVVGGNVLSERLANTIARVQANEIRIVELTKQVNEQSRDILILQERQRRRETRF